VLHDRTCPNPACRVVTYKGDHAMPLSACPVCLTPGGAASPQTGRRTAALTDDRSLT
jgi:hypothetical protein